MIHAFLRDDFSTYRGTAFADFTMMPSKDYYLTVLKEYIASLYLEYSDGATIGWKTAKGRQVLRALADRLARESDYSFVPKLLTAGLLLNERTPDT